MQAKPCLSIAGANLPLAAGRGRLYDGCTMNDFALSLAMLAMVALLWGGWYQYRRNGPNLQTLLMVVMALVLLGNVVIWQMPAPQTQPDEAADAQGAPAAR